ncbi:DUF6497 family protein [Puniceibacterium sediminis]|uniref:Uncharacterized protein n=1 Tax=Puniceibacterium sediminis TaxID=1608407 RepID=A0A238XAK0_9RHOB|nr:DUF6497 family protein [Puniceibacterium sediminis]SNR55591.1 hypothetical protein SAMN06265370_11031 [Puniceibacterium sediminis]
MALDPVIKHTVAGRTQDRAAPARGALKWGWGCLFVCLTVCAPGMALATGGADDAVLLPSGETAQLQELIQENLGEALIARFRFVAPWIAGGTDYDTVAADMENICQTYALGRLADIDMHPTQVIISLSAAESKFGVATPEVTQFFEAFSLSDGRCIWEPF